MSKSFDLASTYVHLRANDSATAMKVGPRFWATIEQRTDLDAGRLMGAVPQRVDWPHWERHPAGEEILTLLSGELVMILDTKPRAKRVPFKAGQTFVVPKGIWHRAEVKKKGMLMFITPGAGTEHRPVKTGR